MSIALATNYLTPYRVPLFRLLAQRFGVELLCYGGGERYVPAWFSDLDAQLAAAPFPARRLRGAREALALGTRHEAVIAPVAGGAVLPAAYLGARLARSPFVLWASVWSRARSARHALAWPLLHSVYRHAGAVVAYGEHARAHVARYRGRDDDVFVAPQSVEQELFGRPVSTGEVERWRANAGVPPGAPVVLFAGRLVPEKGVEVLLEAFARVRPPALLAIAGDGPLAGAVAAAGPRVLALGAVERERLPVAYAAASLTVVPSIPTPLFREPWGLVCNEAMLQGCPVVATTAVGAVAGGFVRDGETGLTVAPGDAASLAVAIERLLGDERLRARLGATGRDAARGHTYEAMADAFGAALRAAGVGSAR